MNTIALHAVLLAQSNPLENFAKEFQGREDRLQSGYLTTGLLVLLALVIAICLLAKLMERFDGRTPVNSSWMLFFSLCKAHRLRWSQRWLLWRLARRQGLNDPARLFLEPEHFDPDGLGHALGRRRAELKTLRQRLFDGAEAPPSEPPARESAPAREECAHPAR